MTQPSATVVADSLSPAGKRLTSVQVTAHRFILAEINTHRMLSRSYRSSRAVPSKRLIEEVRTDPAMPSFWGKNQPGMQAREELDDSEIVPGWVLTARGIAERRWRDAAIDAARAAELLASTGLHKQVANRVLEPFLWVHGVITATEWDNFFGLRLHEDAQPEFRDLAAAIWNAMKLSEPYYLNPGDWHLPYVDDEDFSDAYIRASGGEPPFPKALPIFREKVESTVIKVSVARCARSSYNSFDTGKRSTIEEDLATYAKLNIPGTENYNPLRPIHASPAEHQGTPDVWNGDLARDQVLGSYPWMQPYQHGNFVGFRQYRKMLPGEAVAPLPEAYR